jgi:hypothetical protein
VSYFVATERLGWPRRRWWHITGVPLGEVQTRLQYDIEPTTPTATCHVQSTEQSDAPCGYPWEALIAVPGQPAWRQLPHWLRCDGCEAAIDADQHP